MLFNFKNQYLWVLSVVLMTNGDVENESRLINFNRQEVGVLLVLNDKALGVEDVKAVLSSSSRKFDNLYVTQLDKFLPDVNIMPALIVPVSIKNNTQTSHTTCIHLEVNASNIETVVAYAVRVNRNARGPVCGFFFDMQMFHSNIEANQSVQQFNQFVKSIQDAKAMPGQPFSVTAIFMDAVFIYDNLPRSQMSRRILDMADVVFCGSGQYLPSHKDPWGVSVEAIEKETLEFIDGFSKSSENCRSHVREISPHTPVGMGPHRVIRKHLIDDIQLVHIWKSMINYSQQHMFDRYLVQANLEVRQKQGVHVGLWKVAANETKGEAYLVENICQKFECGAKLVELTRYMSPPQLVGNQRGALVTLVSLYAGGWGVMPYNNWTVFHSILPSAALALRCYSPYPVKWVVQGYMSPNYVFEYGPTIISTEGGSIVYSAYIRLMGKMYDNQAGSERASLQLTCGLVEGGSEYSPSFIVLDEDGKNYVGDRFIEETDQLNEYRKAKYFGIVQNLNSIQCAVSSLFGNVSLLKNGIVVDSLDYFLPYDGFVLRHPYVGNYTCVFHEETKFNKTGSNYKTSYSKVRVIKPYNDFFKTAGEPLNLTVNSFTDNVIVKPMSQYILLYLDESVSLFCCVHGGNSAKNELDFEIVPPLPVTLNSSITSPSTEESCKGLRMHLNALPASITFQRFYVSCKSRQFKNVTFWAWELAYNSPPKAYLDNRQKDIQCLFKDDPTGERGNLFSGASCRTAAHCAFVQSWTHGKGPFGGKIDGLAKSSSSTVAGLATCVETEYDTLATWRRSFIFFSTLSGRWAFSWVALPKGELLQLTTDSDVHFSGAWYSFQCRAVAFHFAMGAGLTTIYDNGTTRSTIVNPGTYSLTGTIAYDYNYDVSVSMDLVAVACSVRWWNSTESVSSKLPLSVMRKEGPTILKSNTDAPADNVTLTAGSPGTLNCTATIGRRPQTQFVWERIHEDGEPTVINSTATRNDNEDTTTFVLNFERVTHKDEGLYRCIASNSITNVTHYYHLNVVDPISNTVLYISVVAASFFVIVCLLALVGILYYNARKKLQGLTAGEQDEFFCGTEPYDNTYEVEEDTINKGEQLGAGEFGVVFKGTCENFPGQQLAIKSTKPWNEKEKLKAMLEEVKLMIRVGEHPHVVHFIGACTNKLSEGKLCILLGYCSGGDLRSHLRKISIPTDEEAKERVLQDLYQWSMEIAVGMEYIHSKNIVHGDLAARNVLLDENRTAKISDFGLSKQLYNNTSYRRRQKIPLPWGWMAPESLSTRDVSAASDVWSFGVTLWEIFSFGMVPYASGTWDSQHEADLRGGHRLTQPHMATEEVYFQMRKCWNYDPDQRPGFTALKGYFFKDYNNATYFQMSDST